MDEATSALDYKTEDNIMRDLNLKNTDLTAIIVSHRSRAVKNCDLIYYLENGKIKDFGSFNNLSKKYKKLEIKKLIYENFSNRLCRVYWLPLNKKTN